MDRAFDPDAIKAQIANLNADRDRIDQAIAALEAALRSIQSVSQPQLHFESDISLHEAVKNACIRMIDGITRQRVLAAIEKSYPYMRPKSSSVAASLINLSKGANAMLKIATEGQGSKPSFYSSEGDMLVELSADEIEALTDESATRGTGGWQSLWLALLHNFDKATGQIKLTPELRARLYHYYHDYGVGGWQNRSKRVFRRLLPHLFLA
jgi:hypothetical protein